MKVIQHFNLPHQQGATMRLGNFYHVPPDHWHLLSDEAVVRDTAIRYGDRHHSLQGAEHQIEEFVRQWMLAQIVGQYQYPASWIGSQLCIAPQKRCPHIFT